MAKNKINDLRNHLFETLEALKDPEKPMDLERARAISLVAQTIINTATVEVKLLGAVGGRTGTNFFETPGEASAVAARPKRLNGPPH